MFSRLTDKYFKDLPREVAVLTTVAFCVALGFGIVAPVIPVFAKTFGVSALDASAVVSVFALMRLISATPAGWLVNRVGERTVLWVGLLIVAVSSAFAGLSQTFPELLILRGLGGTGSAMFTVSSMSLLLRTVDPAHRGRATGTYQSGFLLGGLAGPAVGGLVVGFSIRAPFFVYAGTLMLAVMTAYFALPRGLGHPDKDTSESPQASQTEPPMHIKQALKLRAYWTALTINLSTGMTSFGLRSSLLPLFVIEVLHKDARTSSMGFLVSSLAQAALLLPAGRLADTRGRRPALILGTTGLTIAMLILVAHESVAFYFLAMIVMGLSGAFLGAGPAAVIGDIVGSRRGGPVVATYQMTGDLGTVAGPLIAGFLRDVTGGYGWPFAVGAGVAALSMMMATVMPETKKSEALAS